MCRRFYVLSEDWLTTGIAGKHVVRQLVYWQVILSTVIFQLKWIKLWST